jgi:cytochrome P450
MSICKLASKVKASSGCTTIENYFEPSANVDETVENLRMHPIASEFGRRTMENSIVLDGHVIPPYTVVSASYRALHLNEDHWPQADRFWPERFLAEDHPMRGNAPPAE